MKSKTAVDGSDGESWSNLESLEREVRKEIGAFRGTKFSQAARWLERTDDLQRRRDALQHELSERLRGGMSLLNPTLAINSERPASAAGAGESESEVTGARGGKARGRECRAAYLAQQARNG